MRSNLGREAELNIRKWAWPQRPTDGKRGRDGREGAKITVPGAKEGAGDEGRFFPRCWLAAPRRPSLPLSVSRRVLGKRELCFRDTDVSQADKSLREAIERMSETATAAQRSNRLGRRPKRRVKTASFCGHCAVDRRLLCLSPPPPPTRCLSPFSFSPPTDRPRPPVCRRPSPPLRCCTVIGRKVGAINIARI